MFSKPSISNSNGDTTTMTPSTASENLPLVTFDDFGKLRLLPANQFEASEKLKEECKDFKEHMGEFISLIQDLMRNLELKANEIEHEKLKAIAARTSLEREPSKRMAEMNRLSFLLREKQLQHDRISAELDSYLKLEQEQQMIIDSLRLK